ncbi:TrbC/VirB2 family protein [Rhodanobacter sp. 7MK24]|uniref:TrbC/VirB2 family protein n=1 Tax=Rhodanobacter sp. 7MK24 TaxID=2775922 RepID=UPI0017801B57|nr:TrbC/VirB2 family protein [Rhodanobacter sp. 7MK24]MBD8881538.1 TrbC/VirB2 family protein [Rhodanobacter sp. 7MK24]
MAPNQIVTDSLLRSSRARLGTFLYVAITLALILPNIALADPTDAITTTCTFANNINMLLNAVSIVVVTIAVVFSGYQIAFAHKRIGEVAPVMIGAILIGAASQIAKMFLGTSAGSSCTVQQASLISHALSHYA